jgi:hypothetical protein
VNNSIKAPLGLVITLALIFILSGVLMVARVNDFLGKILHQNIFPSISVVANLFTLAESQVGLNPKSIGKYR